MLHTGRFRLLASSCLALLFLSLPALGQTLSEVPGTVVYSRPSPSSRFWPAANRIYTTSPSILKLPNGDILLAFNLFGGSLVPPASESGTTYIYRSSDGGATWTNLTPEPMMRMKRGSLFLHDGVVHLWGYTTDSGDAIIRRSTDHGETWTEPTDGSNGLLLAGTMGGTPFNPVLHEGRWWMAQGGKRIMSAPATADLMAASNWVRSSSATTDDGPFGITGSYAGVTITEGQIVASPRTGVVVMPKIESEPRTVLIRATGPGSVANPGLDDWVDLPGAGKKFAASYDPVSDRFYALTNPVLPAHFNHNEPWNMIRNTAALLVSDDLRNWKVLQLFLYGPHVEWEGWQYLNFDFDGDDLIVASRTAFDITGEPGISHRPPRGHDTNLITFHRITGFRNAVPDQVLKLRNGVVERWERTQHAEAPLGLFAPGSILDGSPLGTVTGMATSDSGDIVLRTASGAVHRFDRLGHHLGTSSASGAAFQESPLPLEQPPAEAAGWTALGGGRWDETYHWHYWNRADTTGEVAHFGSSITAPATVTLERSRSISGLVFRSHHGYRIEGAGELVIALPGGNSEVATQTLPASAGATVRGLSQNTTTHPLGYFSSGNLDRNIIGAVGTSGNRRNHNAILTFDLPAELPEGIHQWELRFTKSGTGSSQRSVDLYGLDPLGAGFSLDASLWHEGGVANNSVDGRPFATLLASEVMVNADPIGKTYTVDVGSYLRTLYNGRVRKPGLEQAFFRLNLSAMPGIGNDNRYQAIHNDPAHPQGPQLFLATTTLPSDSQPALVHAGHGEHAIAVPLRLAAPTVLRADAGAHLSLLAGLRTDGSPLQITGSGTVTLGGTIDLSAGRLVLSGVPNWTFATDAQLKLGGELAWHSDPESPMAADAEIRILPEGVAMEGTPSSFLLGRPGIGLRWDTSMLQSSGTLRAEPDPSWTPPSVRLDSMHDSRVSLALAGPAGYRVSIEVSADLVHWQEVAAWEQDSPPADWTDPEPLTEEARFYRARVSLIP